jgi:hypothetical protein
MCLLVVLCKLDCNKRPVVALNRCEIMPYLLRSWACYRLIRSIASKCSRVLPWRHEAGRLQGHLHVHLSRTLVGTLEALVGAFVGAFVGVVFVGTL